MVRVKVWLAVCGVSVSETDTANTDDPAAVGTPEITPPESRLKPAGRLPAVSDQV
jgi:hypothetical protein